VPRSDRVAPGFGRADAAARPVPVSTAPKGMEPAIERAEKHSAPVAKSDFSANREKDLIDHPTAEIDQLQPMLATLWLDQRSGVGSAEILSVE
jgi:hypothetical protein